MVSNNHQDISAVEILKTNPEIFRLLLRSDYLAAKEYGKLLLLTSKSLTEACFVREEVYDWLCRSRWGESAKTMIDGMGISPYNCFILLQKQKSRRPNVPYLDIRPLQYSPEDYRLVITVFDDHGYPRVSKFLHGQDITDFFQLGCLSLNGLSDVALGAAKNTGAGVSRCADNPFQKWRATVHAFRIPDQKSLCLYHSNTHASLKGMYLTFCTNNDPLQMNDGYGLQLLECRDTISYGSRNYEGIVFDLSMGLCSMESNGAVIGDNEEILSGNKDHDVIFHSLRLDAYVVDSHGNISTLKFPKKMGKMLTFAHILESLYGWQN